MNGLQLSRQASSNALNVGPEGRRVLSVERDPQLIAAARSLLQELGFELVVATTLLGARAACRARRFDLMIIGSSIPHSTAEALVRLVTRCGGPPSLHLRECRSGDDQGAKLLRMLRAALET